MSTRIPTPTPQTQRHYICYRAPSALTPPVLDGRIDKPFWAAAPWTDEFMDIEGDAKPKPRHATRAKLLWDDENLYIAAWLDEPRPWATLTQRDAIVYHDNDFEVFLNPTGDNHRYYELEINALNTIFDLYLPKPYKDSGKADHDWNVAGLKSAVFVDGALNDPSRPSRGWSVELVFPWRAFDRHAASSSHPPSGAAPRPGPTAGDQWRLNFSRVQWDLDVVDGRYVKVPDRPEHNWVWSPQGVVDMHRPEMWGYLQFSPIVAGQGLEEPRVDPSIPVRQWLHRVYYAQRAFHAAEGRWAASLTELLRPAACAVPLTDEQFTRIPGGWSCQATALLGGEREGQPQTWSINHEALIQRVR